MTNKKTSNKKQARQSVVAFTDSGWEDYLYMQKEEPKLAQRINELIDACLADPFKGIGKPEPLKGNLTGLWSRRIDLEHRLVYAVMDDTIHVVGCRFHY
ncbi:MULTISPECIES: Txe/YoeB family addiction module toxin [unclassified Duganella]|uniref:Txe/YoeB family addiction module toxin n=1 Tax=unclassified Duganella TaxID=2636909 RepID=UPI000E34802C|nr:MULTISPECIES: Txe/YoeB family addiction module toxin [unclassified Duganella]RFP11385.1 Txe/YoeB family addiction module toxin [Duganella sp. BJB475]RFP29705.1 Txe/YoeB family addiction module toxin [Duganella sp. BJB476]